MATYEYTVKHNLQDGAGSEFEQIKREVLSKVNPDSYRCLVMKNKGLEVVRFAGFEMTPEGKVLVAFCRISEFAVPKEYREASMVHSMGELYEWPEARIANFGYSTSEMRRVK